MRSNYRRIGDLIHLVDERNKGLNVSLLLGLTIAKKFIPSVANTVGTDMENYKIIRRNQFACSLMQVRRDKRIPVALVQEFDEAIISQAYPIFEVNDTKEILPEYLMMWFSREEFDREACFYAVGGVRGSLEWEDFCNMKLPVPDITKQQEIIDEYNTIKNRISLNNGLIGKLEETAQAVYREWFVDFEFPFDFAKDKPNENGEPYKSSGGEMEFCEELEKDVPKGWRVTTLGKEVSNIKDITNPKELSTDIKYVPIELIPKKSLIFNEGLSIAFAQSSLIKFFKNDILIGAMRVYFHRVSLAPFDGITRSTCFVLRPNNINYLYYYLLTCFQNDSIAYANSTSMGTTMPYAVWENGFELMPIIIPNEELNIKFNDYVQPMIERLFSLKKETTSLNKMKDLILSKMASEG